MSDHTTLKRCTKCGESKPATIEFFVHDKQKSDGLCSHCKECRTKYNQANKEKIAERNRRYREANRDKLREQWRQYNRANKERKARNNREYREKHREELNAYSREYRAANQEKIAELNRQWREANKEYLSESLRQWREENPEQARKIALRSKQRRRARKRNLPDDFTADDWQYALDYFNGCCAICDRPMNGFFHSAHCDHFVPLSSDDCPGSIPANMLPLCGGLDGCNSSKGGKDPIEWLTEKFGPRKTGKILARIEAFFGTVRQTDSHGILVMWARRI